MKAMGIYRINGESEEFICPVNEEVVFGRSQVVHVKVDDIRCNGIHALLERGTTKREFFLVDLGSEFGTFVNGQKINESVLKKGDTFSIGKQIYSIKPFGKMDQNDKVEDLVPLTLRPAHQLQDKFTVRQKNLASERNVLQVVLYWGTQALDVRTFSEGSEITLGTGQKHTFSVIFKDSNLSSIKIASYKKGQLQLRIPKEANGLVWIGSDVFNLDALRLKDELIDEDGHLLVNLRVADRANIQFGELALKFQFVDPPDSIPLEPLSRIEKPFRRIFLASLLVFLLLGVAIAFFEVEEEVKTLKDIPQHLKRVIYDAGIQSAMKKRRAAIGQMEKTLKGGRARSEEGQSSARKKPNPKQEKKVVKEVKKVEQNKKRVAPQLDLDSVFAKSVSSKVVSKVSIKGPSKSGNTASALTKGNFARGNKGLGAGGGGQSVGIGELQGLNTGGGMGTQDYGMLPSKGREIVVPDQEEVLILGGLDPDVIAAIIRRYLAQIQHCYEQQLVVHPNLKGKVTVSFIIGSGGDVKSASVFESSLHNAKVEMCMIEKIKNWKFPKPKGGGTVGVKYPFLMMSNTGNGG